MGATPAQPDGRVPAGLNICAPPTPTTNSALLTTAAAGLPGVEAMAGPAVHEFVEMLYSSVELVFPPAATIVVSLFSAPATWKALGVDIGASVAHTFATGS